MGSSQSKPIAEQVLHEKAVLERVATLNCEPLGLDDDIDVEELEEFVHVALERTREARLSRTAEALPVKLLGSWQSRVLRDPKNRLALSALSSANPMEVLASRSTKIADQHVFNTQIPLEGGPITNQRSSGRCWLFASTNVFRVALMRKYNLDSFELSQAYLFFWDKLEKANYFLENIIDLADEDLDSRLVQRVLADPVSDGGQWDMVYNLVEKYGLVPQALYPDSWNAMNSRGINYIIVAKLREYAVTLRKLLKTPSVTAATISAAKERMMRQVHLILTLTLGPPPSATDAFDWTFKDKKGRVRTVSTSPVDFARDIAAPELRAELRVTSATIAAMVSLVHDPRHAALSLLSVDRLGNVVGGRGVTYINVEMAALKRAAVDMLRSGLPVFFGCDVGKFSDRQGGVMDLDLVDYELGFNVGILGGGGGSSMGGGSSSGGGGSTYLDKADRLRVGESAMTHAMVLTAVHVDERTGQPVRWRVQNSWGEGVGEKGWFVMSDAWMDEFTYQAVVDARFLTREVRDVLKKEPIVLPLWDPLGSLA